MSSWRFPIMSLILLSFLACGQALRLGSSTPPPELPGQRLGTCPFPDTPSAPERQNPPRTPPRSFPCNDLPSGPPLALQSLRREEIEHGSRAGCELQEGEAAAPDRRGPGGGRGARSPPRRPSRLA